MVNISRVKISLDRNAKEKSSVLIQNGGARAMKFPNSDILICIDELILSKDSKFLKFIDSNILINHNKIILHSTLNVSDICIRIDSKFERYTENIFSALSVFTVNNKINMHIVSKGTIDFGSLNITQNASIRKLKYKGFSLNGSSCFFSKMGSIYNLNLTGVFGSFELTHSLNDITQVRSNIDISEINKRLHGNIKLDFKHQSNQGNIKINAKNLAIFGLNCGQFRLFGTKNSDDLYNILCVHSISKKIQLLCTKGKYEMKFIVKNKTIGTIGGNLKTGEISAGIKNINLSDIPLLSYITVGTKGSINISGVINKISGRIDCVFKNITLLGLMSADLIGSVIRNNGMYIFNFYKKDNSVVFNSIVKDRKIILADLKFIGIDIVNIIRVCGHFNDNILGISNGHIKYQKDNAVTEFDINIFDGVISGNRFKKLELKGDVNLNVINIKHFVVINKLNEVLASMKCIFGFTEKTPVSSVCIDIKNISVRGIKICGHGEFRGQLNAYKNINGVFQSTDIIVSGVYLGNIMADIKISTKKLEIVNLRSDNETMKSSLSLNFKKDRLLGNLNIKNMNICGIYNGLSGFLNSNIKFYGKLSNPIIELSAFVRNGKYLSLPFSFSSKLEYRNGIVQLNKINISSYSTNVVLHGKYVNGENVYLTIINLNEKIINALVNFNLPMSGNFSGYGVLSIKNAKHTCKIFLKSREVYIKALKLNDIKLNIEVNCSNIIINTACAKILDSKIRIDSGFFNLKNLKYGFDLFLINVHYGSIDLFGNIKLLGIVKKIKKSYKFLGEVNLNNLWINRYKLSYFCFDYVVKDKTLEFMQKIDSINVYNLSGSIAFGDTISIRNFNLSKDKTFFNLSGDFSKKSVNLNIKSSNINLRFVTDIFNLPNFIDGVADMCINVSGNINMPNGCISIISKTGFLMDVPYDNFNIEIDFDNNMCYIKNAYVFKQNEISVFMHGSFPFCINKTLSVDMEKKPVNIFYEVNDYKLSILKYLFNGCLKPQCGRLLFNGSFTGNYGKVNSNGILSISGGMFEPNDYLNKIKNLFVEISLINNLVEIEKFNFESGLGKGKINIYGHLKLNNFSINEFALRFVTSKKGIPLRLPQLPLSGFMGSKSLLHDYSSGEPSFDIMIQGTLLKPKISGKITLENTLFTFPGSGKKKNTMIPENTEFDLELITARNTRFENAYISALINGFLYIRGPYGNLKTSGVIETANARMDYFGMKFDISNAKIEILEDKNIYITALGEAIVPSKTGNVSETIKLVVRKLNIEKLFQSDVVKFVSNDDLNIDSRKTLKKITEIYHQNNQLFVLNSVNSANLAMGQHVLRLFDQMLTTPFTRAILRKTKLIDDFRVSYVDSNYKTVGFDKNQTFASLFLGTKYTLEKNIANKIFLEYSITFKEFNIDALNSRLTLHHGIETRYKLTNNLFLNGNFELKSQEIPYKPDRKIMIQYHLFF
jgi:hypothetical protein